MSEAGGVEKITFPIFAAIDTDGRVLCAADDLLLMLASLEHEYAAQGRDSDANTVGRLHAALSDWRALVAARVDEEQAGGGGAAG